MEVLYENGTASFWQLFKVYLLSHTEEQMFSEYFNKVSQHKPELVKQMIDTMPAASNELMFLEVRQLAMKIKQSQYMVEDVYNSDTLDKI